MCAKAATTKAVGGGLTCVSLPTFFSCVAGYIAGCHIVSVAHIGATLRTKKYEGE